MGLRAGDYSAPVRDSSSRPQNIVRRLGGRAATAARASYYSTAYHAQFPGKEAVEDRLHRWESAVGRGDIPQDESQWNEQYGRGRWDFLGGIEEMAHYAVIVGYATLLKPHSSVLDVGCGAGVLHERFAAVGYERYTGVDISEVAVRSLQESAPPDANFVAADASTYTPTAPTRCSLAWPRCMGCWTGCTPALPSRWLRASTPLWSPSSIGLPDASKP